MKRKYAVYVVWIMVLLSGCASVRQPPLQLDGELGYTASIASAYEVDAEWWRQYENDELNALVEKALANNPDYLIAALNINKELYSLNLSTSDLFPTLYGSLGASSRREIYTEDHFNSNFSGEFGLNYEVDLYGKIRDLQSAQKFEYQATVMDKEAAKLSLINSVVDLYFNLEYLKNSADLTQENIRAYQELLTIARQKYHNGKADYTEVLQAEQSLLSEQNRLLELETQFKEMEASLKNILNLKSDESLDLHYSNILEQKLLDVELDVPAAVLARRPDLAASQKRLEKAFKILNAEEKNWYPDVSVNGLTGSSSEKGRTTFDFPYILGSVSVNLPFLDWNRVKNNVKISEADYEIALVEFKDTLAQALNEISYYTYAYSKSADVLENVGANYQNARQISSYYQKRYDSGKNEFKDFLEAVSNENSLKKNLVQQKYQLIKYENYIFKAMAGRYQAKS